MRNTGLHQALLNYSIHSEQIENITIPVPSTGGGNLQPVMMNTSTSNLSTSASASTVPVQNHVPSSSMNHVSKQTPNSSQSNVVNTDQVRNSSTHLSLHNRRHSAPNDFVGSQILTKTRLQDLVKEIDPCEQLDEEVEDLLLLLVDDFVNSTVNTACVFAKHRNAGTVEVKDVQLYLGKSFSWKAFASRSRL